MTDFDPQYLTRETIEEMLHKAQRQMHARAEEIREKQPTLVVMSDEGFLMVFHVGASSDLEELETLVRTAHTVRTERRTVDYLAGVRPDNGVRDAADLIANASRQAADVIASERAHWIGRSVYTMTVGAWAAAMILGVGFILGSVAVETTMSEGVVQLLAFVVGAVLTIPAAFLIGPAIASAAARKYLRGYQRRSQ